jgi:transposase
MKPYSLDLRAKIVEACLQQDGAIRQLAHRFKVSARFVWALIHCLRRTGSYAPKPPGGGNPSCIQPSHYKMIAKLVKQDPEATLAELCRHVEATCQVTPSKSSMPRVLDKLQLTRKTRRSMPPSVIRMTSKHNAKPTQRR